MEVGLKWFLVLVTLLIIVFWAVLTFWAAGFRQSFGASETGVLLNVGPLIGFGALLLAFLWPLRWLGFVALALAGGGLIGSLCLIPTAPILAGSGILYFSAILLHFKWTIFP